MGNPPVDTTAVAPPNDNSTTVAEPVVDDEPWWLETLSHHGTSAFNPDASYQVFRNVKVTTFTTHRLFSSADSNLLPGLWCSWRWCNRRHCCHQVRRLCSMFSSRILSFTVAKRSPQEADAGQEIALPQREICSRFTIQPSI